jgi:hypothetical protein
LPKRPTAEQLAIIFEMFQDSIDGELYDPAKFSQHYKPFGFDAGSSDDDEGGEGKRVRPSAPAPRAQVPTTQPKVTPATVVEDDEPPFDADPPKATSTPVKEEAKDTAGAKSPQEILAMLRNRNK